MSRLLPSSPELSRRSPEPRLLEVDDEATDEVFEALASETARTIFATLHDDPATASALAETADTSVQNVRYHLEQLQAADLVEVAGTQYSSKGREMSVYAPADAPLVMLAGGDDPAAGLRAVLERLVGAIAALSVLSLLAHVVVEGEPAYLDFTGAAGRGETGLPVAAVVFLGGLAVLGVALVRWYRSDRPGSVRGWVCRYPALSGRDLAFSRRAVLAAAVGAVALAALWLWSAAADVVLAPVGPFGPAQWLLAALVAAPTVQAYANDGLAVSWAAVFLPVFVLGLASLGPGLAAEGLAAVPGVIGYPALLGLVGAVTVGTLGFAVGVGLRVAVAGIRGGSPPTTDT